MTYFNYHAKIKNKIKSNMLVQAKFVDSYKKIKPALLLYFNDGTMYPIREYRFCEYLDLIKDKLN